jgi:hypothetical protein
VTNIIYTGVDPGKNGAIASIDQDGAVLKISRFKDADTEGRIALVIADHFAELDDGVHAATIERVGAMPKQGLSSTFTFGRVYGEAWAGLLLSKGGGVRVHAVTPSMWQRDMYLPKRDCVTNHKRTLKEEAEKRFGRKFILAEADAVWLAEWSRMKGPWSRGMRAEG